MTSSQKIEVRWKSHLHYHLVLIRCENQTSIHKEHFACGIFVYQFCFVNEKHVQRGPRYKKWCPWDGVYLRTSIMFQTGGKPSTWCPPVGLVGSVLTIYVSKKFIFQIFETSSKQYGKNNPLLRF